MARHLLLAGALAIVPVFVACSQSDTSSSSCPKGLSCDAGGAGTTTGGVAASTGGETSSSGGQAAGTGGETTSTGGEAASTGGEATNTGGEATNTGGVESTGGSAANTGGVAANTGGVESTGGSAAQGGDASGGASTGGDDAGTAGAPDGTGGSGTALPDRCTVIDGSTAPALVASGAVLVDVRTAAEYDAGHVADAINIPLDELSGRLDELPTDGPIIVYCQSGNRSSQAAAILCDAGLYVLDLGAMSNYPV